MNRKAIYQNKIKPQTLSAISENKLSSIMNNLPVPGNATMSRNLQMIRFGTFLFFGCLIAGIGVVTFFLLKLQESIQFNRKT